MKGNGVTASTQRARYVLTDLAATAVAFFTFNIYRYFALKISLAGGISLWSYLSAPKLITEQSVIPFILLSVYWLSGYYNRPFDKSRLQELVTTFFSAVINSMLIYLSLLIDDQSVSRAASYEMLGVLFSLLLSFTYAGRLAITHSTIKKLKERKWAFNTIIIGDSRIAHQTAYNLTKSSSRLGYKIVGFVHIPGERPAENENDSILFDNIGDAISDLHADQLIIATENHDEEKVLTLLFKLFHHNVPVKIAPDTLSYVTSGIHLQDIYGEPFVDLTSPRCTESGKNIKRTFDVIISSLVLVFLSPLLCILALMVRKSSPGPAIYSQKRIGYRQKPFDIYKFRSMRADAEDSGPQLSSDTDARITPLGKIMRKYRLDELPQFWNVLKGDMSLVGPRPEREFFIRQIVRDAPYYTLVHQVRPGITSWGMVKYGYASSVAQMVERMRFDLIYLANMSTLVDFKILIYTIKTVATGKGV